MRIHVLGAPGDVGGACTELWHTIKMFRSVGHQVIITPTWKAMSDPWASRCKTIGCEIQESTVRDYRPEPGCPVLSMCNSQFFGVLRRLSPAKHPTIWVPCMNYLTDREVRRYTKGILPSAVVCQSNYQRLSFEKQLIGYGLPVDRIYTIRGAFDLSEFEFRPKPTSSDFVVGRISRADPQKFRSDLWAVLERVKKRVDANGRVLRAKVLGWKPSLAKKVGQPPEWAEVYPPGSLDSKVFMQSLDCLYQSGDTPENWSRVGLEAMATGVPIVTDAQGGWHELSNYGRLAVLVDTFYSSVCAIQRIAEPAYCSKLSFASVLQRDARDAIEKSLCTDNWLLLKWQSLFEDITT